MQTIVAWWLLGHTLFNIDRPNRCKTPLFYGRQNATTTPSIYSQPINVGDTRWHNNNNIYPNLIPGNNIQVLIVIVTIALSRRSFLIQMQCNPHEYGTHSRDTYTLQHWRHVAGEVSGTQTHTHTATLKFICCECFKFLQQYNSQIKDKRKRKENESGHILHICIHT